MLSKRIFVLVSLLLVSFLLVGCAPTIPSIGNDPPGITSAPVTDAEVGVEYTYDVDATDPDGDALTYSLTRNPSGMEIDEDTGLITWTPTAAGSFGVTVKVSDGVLYVTQPFTITIMPVSELTGIVVDPDTMALEEGGTGTLIVTANYSFGDSKDVTNTCAYTLTQPDAGVITVTAGSVEAVGVGTDTIFISYTEGDITATANISVTVSSVMIPMEITVNLPTFTVGGPYWFTVNMIANDDSGKYVVASFGWPKSVGDELIVGTLETDVVSDVTFTLEGDVFQSEAFTLEGTTTVNFRGTFDEAGTYGTTIEVKTSPGDDLLCSEYIEIVVEAAPLKVGDNYEGGIIAYILQSGDNGYVEGETHGLIAAIEDQSEGIIWATEDFQETEVGTLLTIGSGSANTDLIIAQHIDVNVNTYAAGLARAYTGGGFNDWFLPSKDELNKLYINQVAIGGFTGPYYWSSSEGSASQAFRHDFSSGGQTDYYKWSTHNVRAVRAF